ncbi:hypothetical protein [Pseudoalteromonas luteoviolacea]|uniref:Uncharacterized protein n=1 Tax=Pseudoalteromonas luteoviolacea S4054 TaxID=1129367 RepID=A0A0F6AID1_9GAMM|nr:hypothetical protein [Pseudoalteromonas luteoviolacea]AOT09918.1 hypothetical protein S4054249_19760 [Pseudoalteromonas luteoviolacea]AOT14829.1 hypothetical protein S40542_19730 [Pseudoalteromonas luteoviolacea]AOT19745.1 hypothetical protein S4054_19735 [Pseudoalteromonas luteoviolacea]KKE85229.1 hypothetical protein N479_05710 [Pseudoalteromonas luteoviolacea S4054]KZN63999.1 hypothetical protein N481_02955 [Pseudoalteromonas luteoviolacea S4047-1]
MKAKLLISSLSALCISACSNGQSTKRVQPALLTEATPSILTELGHAIVSLKGGTVPTLAVDVFTQSPQLLITHGQSLEKHAAGLTHTSLSSLPISAFELQLRDNHCVLYYPKADQFVPLQYAKCIVYDKKDPA